MRDGITETDYFEGDEYKDRIMLLSDLDDFWYFHYGLTAEETAEIDRRYLPAIYKAIKGRYPNMADYLVELAKKRKIDTSIFEEE